ncbi:hypothetical protein QVD17_01337 [Tagetes erecta]|uniref:Uncharacterized protein n=1 Tax=Tagetes erecta TaxID=13708 RepID=A0AAD8P892_TARER|nr:hypothetical protein QVD17_01337 [Tagetes erecta]
MFVIRFQSISFLNTITPYKFSLKQLHPLHSSSSARSFIHEQNQGLVQNCKQDIKCEDICSFIGSLNSGLSHVKPLSITHESTRLQRNLFLCFCHNLTCLMFEVDTRKTCSHFAKQLDGKKWSITDYLIIGHLSLFQHLEHFGLSSSQVEIKPVEFNSQG